MHHCKRILLVGLTGALCGFFVIHMGSGPGLDPAHAQQPAGSKNYDIRQLRLANGNRELLRFSPAKGDTWRLVDVPQGEVKTAMWEKVDEVGTLPAGNYDVKMLEGADKNSFYALRFDYVTGKTWSLVAGKWTELLEKKGAPKK
jgi:hypothetical protein